MIDYDKVLSNKIKNVKPSGIRKFFDIAATMEGVISLGVGEPDFSTPWVIRNAAIKVLERKQVVYGPNLGIAPLREAISNRLKKKHGVEYAPANQIIVTVGGSEAIDLAVRGIIDSGDEVLIVEPCFVCYAPLVELAGGVAVPIPTRIENNFKLTVDDLKDKVTERTKLLILPFPNNPTGALYSDEILKEIVEIARQNDLILFADEIYDRLVMDGLTHTALASLAPDVPCVSFNGLSKSHRVAGFRVGWMVISGDKKKIKGYIEGLNLLSSMRLCSNVPAQSIVQTALGGIQSVDELLLPGGRIYEQREFVYNALCEIDGISVVKPKAAFYIFPKLDAKKFNLHDDEKLVLDFLKAKKVLLMHGKGFNYPTPDHLRIVYLPRRRILGEAMESFKDFLADYKQ